MSLLRQGKAQALTIYLGESDQWHGKPLYVAIVQYLREQGSAGATVTRAITGFGAGAHLHESSGWRLSSDAPVIIQVVDQATRLQYLLPHIQEMLNGGLITLQEVEVLKYSHARVRGFSSKLPVRQVMSSSITTVGPLTPVSTIVHLLLEAPFRTLPVIDAQGKLEGIISTGDLINAGALPMRRGLVRRALEMDLTTSEIIETPLKLAHKSALTAQDIMNRQVRTIGPNLPIREAAQVMLETGLRRLPVVEHDGILLGMLTRADLLQVIVTSPLMNPNASSTPQQQPKHTQHTEQPVQQRPVADYVNPDIVAIGEQAPLSEIIDALIISLFKRVIVVDEERHVKGIISDVDVLTHIQEEMRPRFLHTLSNWARGKQTRQPTGTLQAHPHHGPVHIAADLMNSEVMTVSATTSVQDTIELMIASHRKALPVVDEHKRLIGMVGRSDLLRILVEG